MVMRKSWRAFLAAWAATTVPPATIPAQPHHISFNFTLARWSTPPGQCIVPANTWSHASNVLLWDNARTVCECTARVVSSLHARVLALDIAERKAANYQSGGWRQGGQCARPGEGATWSASTDTHTHTRTHIQVSPSAEQHTHACNATQRTRKRRKASFGGR